MPSDGAERLAEVEGEFGAGGGAFQLVEHGGAPGGDQPFQGVGGLRPAGGGGSLLVYRLVVRRLLRLAQPASALAALPLPALGAHLHARWLLAAAFVAGLGSAVTAVGWDTSLQGRRAVPSASPGRPASSPPPQPPSPGLPRGAPLAPGRGAGAVRGIPGRALHPVPMARSRTCTGSRPSP